MTALMDTLGTDTALWIIADYLFKLTLVLGASCLLYISMKTLPASFRIRLWKLCFLIVAVLPIWLLLLPSFSIPFFNTGLMEQVQQAQEATDIPALTTGQDSIEAMTASASNNPTILPAESSYAQQSPSSLSVETIGFQQTSPSLISLKTLVLGLLLAWAAGVAIHFWRISKQFRVGSRIRSKATILSPDLQPPALSLLDNQARQEASNYQTSVYISDEISTPIAVGIFKPAVILPAESLQWDEQKRLSSILHEQAHIQHLDIIVRSLALILCCIYWFHPLAWFGFNKLKEEQEKRADNFVIEQGIKASTYADYLMDIVKTGKSMTGLQGVLANIGGYQSFPERMQSLLSDKTRMQSAGKFKTLGMTALAVLVIIASACASIRTDPVVAAESTTTAGTSTQAPIPVLREDPAVINSANYRNLETAIRNRNEDMLEMLLEMIIREDNKEEVKALFADGSLLELAMQSEDEDVIELVMEAIIYTDDKELASALVVVLDLLTLAMETNDEDPLELVLEFIVWTGDTDIMHQLMADGTVLNMAMDANKEDILELVLEAMVWSGDTGLARVQLEDGVILNKAIDTGKEDIIELVLEAIVWSGDTELAVSLMEDGSVLEQAMATNREDVVEIFLELIFWTGDQALIDSLASNDDLKTWAVENNKEEILEYILAAQEM